MTTQEQSELLKRFVEVAPNELGAEMVRDEAQALLTEIDDGSGEVSLVLSDDLWSGGAIIAILDWLEKDGFLIQLGKVSGNKYRASRPCGNIMGQGETRAEAVVRAAIAVREAKK